MLHLYELEQDRQPLCLQVAYHVSDQVPRLVIGDAQRLQQILLNVLNNGEVVAQVHEVHTAWILDLQS